MKCVETLLTLTPSITTDFPPEYLKAGRIPGALATYSICRCSPQFE